MTDHSRYATTAAHLQYTLSVPLAVVLTALVLFQRAPEPAARAAAWCVAASGAALAVTLWSDHLGDIRFPYLPGADLRDRLLKMETQPDILGHPGTTACVAAGLAVACLIGVPVWASHRPTHRPTAPPAWTTWARAITVLLVVAMLIGPVFEWWPHSLVPGETTLW